MNKRMIKEFVFIFLALTSLLAVYDIFFYNYGNYIWTFKKSIALIMAGLYISISTQYIKHKLQNR